MDAGIYVLQVFTQWFQKTWKHRQTGIMTLDCCLTLRRFTDVPVWDASTQKGRLQRIDGGVEAWEACGTYEITGWKTAIRNGTHIPEDSAQKMWNWCDAWVVKNPGVPCIYLRMNGRDQYITFNTMKGINNATFSERKRKHL